MRRTAILLTALLLGTLLLTQNSCSDSLVSDPDDIVFPDTNISYLRHVQPLFNLSCTLSGCHDRETAASNVNLSSYFDTMLRPGLVIPGNPEASLLVQIFDGRIPHIASFQARVNDNHRRGITQWVREGAVQN